MPRLITLLFLCICVICQPCSGQKIETVYLDQKDTTKNLYIAAVPTGSVMGFMMLVPGMFQKPQDVFTQTDLPKYAASQGILTVVATFSTGISSIGFDDETQSSLVRMLGEITTKYKLNDKPFFLGGFSIGGTCALKYAEQALATNSGIKPSALFAIDSPLDFERMFNAIEREKHLFTQANSLTEESDYMTTRMRKAFGGSPREALSNYYKLSPYSFNDTTQRAIKPLVKLPIRLYTEPDVVWWLNEGVDYSGMNSFDFAAMTNELRRMGSTKIELITTENKGYRKPGNIRHPHSWSIVDSKDLVSWLLKSLPLKP